MLRLEDLKELTDTLQEYSDDEVLNHKRNFAALASDTEFWKNKLELARKNRSNPYGDIDYRESIIRSISLSPDQRKKEKEAEKAADREEQKKQNDKDMKADAVLNRQEQ